MGESGIKPISRERMCQMVMSTGEENNVGDYQGRFQQEGEFKSKMERKGEFLSATCLCEHRWLGSWNESRALCGLMYGPSYLGQLSF